MKLQNKNFEESLYFDCQIGKIRIKVGCCIRCKENSKLISIESD